MAGQPTPPPFNVPRTPLNSRKKGLIRPFFWCLDVLDVQGETFWGLGSFRMIVQLAGSHLRKIAKNDFYIPTGKDGNG